MVEFFPKVPIGPAFVQNTDSYAWGAMASWDGSGEVSDVASVALITAFTDSTCQTSSR